MGGEECMLTIVKAFRLLGRFFPPSALRRDLNSFKPAAVMHFQEEHPS